MQYATNWIFFEGIGIFCTEHAITGEVPYEFILSSGTIGDEGALDDSCNSFRNGVVYGTEIPLPIWMRGIDLHGHVRLLP